jgi:N-acetylneuraminic acid mutarotase
LTITLLSSLNWELLDAGMRKTPVGIAIILMCLATSFLEVVNFASESTMLENSWVTKTPMKTARADFGVGTVNGRIYVITESSTDEYDPATGNWTQKQPMLTPRSNFAAAVYNNKIYVMSGIVGVAPAVNCGVYNYILAGTNEEYDPVTNAWVTKTPMPTPRRDLQANVVGNSIYLIGGIEQGQLDALLPMAPISSNANEAYNPLSDS